MGKCRSEGPAGSAGTQLSSVFPHSCAHGLKKAAPSVLHAGGGKGKAHAPPERASSKRSPQSPTQLLLLASHWLELGHMAFRWYSRCWEMRFVIGGIVRNKVGVLFVRKNSY